VDLPLAGDEAQVAISEPVVERVAAQGQGTWQGATGNLYPEGGLVFSNIGGPWISNEAEGFDLRFQTFVATN
jgi:hypothetical protein